MRVTEMLKVVQASAQRVDVIGLNRVIVGDYLEINLKRPQCSGISTTQNKQRFVIRNDAGLSVEPVIFDGEFGILCFHIKSSVAPA